MTHSQSPHIRVRFGIYHFVRRVPADVQQYYRSDRVSISLRTKSPKAASRAATRNSRYVVEALGNRPITAYASSDAAAFRDHLFAKGLSLGSVKRIFGSVFVREAEVDGYAKVKAPRSKNLTFSSPKT